jgi:hypothetical protein
VSGVTVKNGYAKSGGGIYIYPWFPIYTAPTIQHCIFINPFTGDGCTERKQLDIEKGRRAPSSIFKSVYSPGDTNAQLDFAVQT